MKKLFRKKWFRRGIQVLVVLITFLALATAVLNRWAAGEKITAVKALETAGHAVGSVDLVREMPPDVENFAMIPLMARLLKEERGQAPGKGGTRQDVTPLEGVGSQLHALGVDRNGDTFKFPRDGSDIDLAMMAQGLGLAGSAGDMLEQFDRRHGEVLAGLREGLGRPWAAFPARFDPSNPREAIHSSSAGILRLRDAAVGMMIRADLAMEAGNGEVALESALIGRKLADLAFSDDTWIGKLVAWSIDHALIRTMKRGLDAGIWDLGQTVILHDAWSQRDSKESISHTLNVEGLCMAAIFDHSKRDRALILEVTPGPTDIVRRIKWELVPDAWFDARSAGILDRTRSRIDLVVSDHPLQVWWDAADAIDQQDPSTWDNLLTGWQGYWDNVVAESALRTGSRAIVEDSLVRLSLRLAGYRLENGSYPSSLDEIGGESIIDPLNKMPFVYRREGDRFELYSIGPDGIDDGGSQEVSEVLSFRDQPDWVWREAW